MRTTSSFDIFPLDASERALAKARWLRQEGRLQEAEQVYRGVMQQQPDLRNSWTECFDLLRRSGRTDDALALAAEAEREFETEAFPITLRGAALAEQELFSEALEALEAAVGRDPDLAMTWHELGYLAHRIGDATRALVALDRAFALEPHTETLTLRGRILRETGELYAATVAFEAAMHSATHDEQLVEIEREVLVTQRFGDFAPRRPRDLTRAERWFAEHGTVVLAATTHESAPTTEEIVQAFVSLARDRAWEFGQVVADDDSAARRVAELLEVSCEPLDRIDIDRVPLVFAERPPEDHPHWQAAIDAVRTEGRGMILNVWHAISTTPHADVVGGLEEDGQPLPLGIDPAHAIVMAQHPGARVATQDLLLPQVSTLQSE